VVFCRAVPQFMVTAVAIMTKVTLARTIFFVLNLIFSLFILIIYDCYQVLAARWFTQDENDNLNSA